MFIDTHCHLDFPEFDSDRPSVIQRAKEGGVDYIVNIGSSIQSSEASVKLAQDHEFIFASVGVHPHDADGTDEATVERIKELAKEKKVVAIGEIGLDYYRNFSKAENQKALFASLLELGIELGLPFVLHCRKAESDLMEILRHFSPKKAVVHCFSGGEDFLKECLDMGFFISFTCNITYKKAQDLKGIVKITPLERIMLETDAPYLSPEGLRGRRNEPLNAKFVADEIARIKERNIEEVYRATTSNAKGFFGLK